MAKGRKKKKDLDFQKVKLKVGRRLKKDDNETKAEFRTRKIVLKEVRSFSHDPVAALSRHGDHISHQGKLSILNHFNAALKPELVQTLNKPIIDSLSKFILDQSSQVRAVAIKCLKTCYNNIKQQHCSTYDFMLALRPYLDCAYTHVNRDIVGDCQKFLEYLVNLNDPQIFQPLMMIMLRRLEAGNLTQSEKALAAKLKHYYLRHEQKQTVQDMLQGDRIEPLVWSETNHVLDLDFVIHNLDPLRDSDQRDVCLVSVQEDEDVEKKFLSLKELSE